MIDRDTLRHPSVCTDEMISAFEELKDSILHCIEYFNDLVALMEYLCELPIYNTMAVKEYGTKLAVHKNDIYKNSSKPQKVQRVYRRWRNDYTYCFA